MGQKTNIEWCDATVNLWLGCSKVHAGCDNCYAETLSKRFGNDIWGNDKPRKLVTSAFNTFGKIQREAQKNNTMRRVFVGSMMDIFEKPMPLIDNEGNEVLSAIVEHCTTDYLRTILFDHITNGLYPNLMFLFLTKRPSNINKYIPEKWKQSPPLNVMFGTSISDQQTANNLVPMLMQVRGRKFLSIEPMLGPIDFREIPGFNSVTIIDELRKMWVIVGGESGHGKRPFDPNWARLIRDQCKNAGVPFFMKQWDKVKEIPEDLMIQQFPA